MAATPEIAPHRHRAHPFDLEHGTDTAGYLRPAELAGGLEHDPQNNGYSAVAPSVFRAACRRWRETLPASASRLETYTFVDVGAGKGRALLMAAELPFRKVIGVELSETLAAIARRNLAHSRLASRAPHRILIRRQDAMRFRWPRSPLLVFLNNPFDCALIAQLAAGLAAAAGRRGSHRLFDLLYVNPDCAESLVASGHFKLLWDESIQMSEADRDADPYGAHSDRVCAFRFSAPSLPAVRLR